MCTVKQAEKAGIKFIMRLFILILIRVYFLSSFLENYQRLSRVLETLHVISARQVPFHLISNDIQHPGGETHQQSLTDILHLFYFKSIQIYNF